MSRQAEIDKYDSIYRTHDNYRMGDARKNAAIDNLKSVSPGSYLDVSCGRGEMLEIARKLGFTKVQGTEVAESLIGGPVVYAEAWELPFEDNAFDVVSLFDVIEHLLPGDERPVCRELARVAKKTVFITAANYSSKSLGVELHVNRRPYPEWDQIFREEFPGVVTWLPRNGSISETWRVDLPV